MVSARFMCSEGMNQVRVQRCALCCVALYMSVTLNPPLVTSFQPPCKTSFSDSVFHHKYHLINAHGAGVHLG